MNLNTRRAKGQSFKSPFSRPDSRSPNNRAVRSWRLVEGRLVLNLGCGHTEEILYHHTWHDQVVQAVHARDLTFICSTCADLAQRQRELDHEEAQRQTTLDAPPQPSMCGHKNPANNKQVCVLVAGHETKHVSNSAGAKPWHNDNWNTP